MKMREMYYQKSRKIDCKRRLKVMVGSTQCGSDYVVVEMISQ